MSDAHPFIDYYDILQVNPDCSPKGLEAAYRHMAKMYHPDHTETADVAKFNQVIEAYRVLRNPDQRAEYDNFYIANAKDSEFRFASEINVEDDERSAISDSEAHMKILLHLYKKRRENTRDAGVIGFYVQEMLNCSEESYDFHVWYLKSKGFIEVTEQGTLAITIEGVDHVISTSRTTMTEKLRLAQSIDPQG